MGADGKVPNGPYSSPHLRGGRLRAEAEAQAGAENGAIVTVREMAPVTILQQGGGVGKGGETPRLASD